MRYVAIITLLAGAGGTVLTYLGMLNMMPLMNWGIIAAIGGIVTIFTRRTAD